MWQSSWHRSGPVEAAAFGISPPHFLNLNLKPGDTYERAITLLRTNSQSTRIIQVEADTPGFADWLAFFPGDKFSFWAGEERTHLNISARVPADAKPGIYKGSVRIAIAPSYDEGVAIAVGARVQVELHVLGPANAASSTTYKQMQSPPLLSRALSDNQAYQNLKGRFIMRPQDRGQLYYIDAGAPVLYHLANRDIAWVSLRAASLGISNLDLARIAAAPVKEPDPENEFARSLAGRILLQAEAFGKLWYVHPSDLHRYDLNSPPDAYIFAQVLATGISEKDFKALNE